MTVVHRETLIGWPRLPLRLCIWNTVRGLWKGPLLGWSSSVQQSDLLSSWTCGEWNKSKACWMVVMQLLLEGTSIEVCSPKRISPRSHLPWLFSSYFSPQTAIVVLGEKILNVSMLLVSTGKIVTLPGEKEYLYMASITKLSSMVVWISLMLNCWYNINFWSGKDVFFMMKYNAPLVIY